MGVTLKIRCLVALLILFPGAFSIAQTHEPKIRQPVDPVGFATTALQMDSVMARILRIHGSEISGSLKTAGVRAGNAWKTVIGPHDDYTYAGWLYPAVLQNVKAKTIIFFGVAHKAKQFRTENVLVFDSFDSWKEPYGPVKVSPIRDELIKALPKDACIVNDSLEQAEHSVEALIPFLQYYNRDIEIISILVPFMPQSRMEELGGQLSEALAVIMQRHGFTWGKDVAIAISTDAVHYGDEGWGSQNYAAYGCDPAGYEKAKDHEMEIINTCLTGEIRDSKIKSFIGYTVREDDYKAYKWTWCGRYSVPFGLMVTSRLEKVIPGTPVKGMFIGYSTSIAGSPIPVKDIGMGETAPATLHHWVGYCAIGYR
jgi:MEMO1 family protein